jgi:hypothetical protein
MPLTHELTMRSHPQRGTLSADDILEVAMAQPGSLVRRAQATPKGNATKISPAPFDYYLDVETADGAVAHRLWFLNSWDSRCEGVRPWGCAERGQVAWAAEAAATAPRPSGASLAFVHIPVQQFKPELLRNPSGTAQEGVNGPAVETGVAAWAHTAGIAALLSGHDHANDYAGYWAPPGASRAVATDADDYVADDGAVLLAYGRNTGYGGYGPGKLQRGARVLELQAGGGLRTWVRQEDGSRVDFGAAFQYSKPPRHWPITEHLFHQLLQAAMCAFLALAAWWLLRSLLRPKRQRAEQSAPDTADPELNGADTVHTMLLQGYNS